MSTGWRAVRRRHARRAAAGAALVAAGVLLGGTVAAAQDDGSADAASGGADDQGGHHGAAGDDPAVAPSGGGGVEPAAGEAARHRRGHGRRHAHEPLAPYEERYAAASPEDQAAADTLVGDVRATLAAYEDVDAAVAAGYRAPRNPHGPFTHYLDPTVAADGHLLDPSRPNGLVYYAGGDGDPVLVGAFFVAPPGVEAPMPAGDLVVWHSHNPGCPRFFATEAEPCTDVRRMVHVWTVDEVELTARRTGEAVAVQVTDPFGAPFRASVTRAG